MAKKSKKRFSPEMAKSGRPIMAAVAIRDVNDKFSSYPSDGLTPVKLARIFKEADAGDPFRQMEQMCIRDRVYTGRTEGGKDRVPKEVYVNGLWILLANAENHNVITLYRVDLGCGPDLDKLYVERMVQRLEEAKGHLDETRRKVEEQNRAYQAILQEGEGQIQEYQERIRLLKEDVYKRQANGWPIPSYQSVCRYISHLMADGQLESAHFLAAKGDRAWKNKRMVKALRDTRSLQVMEVLLGDEHTFDCWVSYKLPNGKVTAIKPKLVAWIDARSRMRCV